MDPESRMVATVEDVSVAPQRGRTDSNSMLMMSIQNVEVELTDLAKNLADLEERLAPVLGHSTPFDSDPQEPNPQRAPARERLEEVTLRVEAAHRMVARLIARLEV